jgi:translation initiation factor IF-3
LAHRGEPHIALERSQRINGEITAPEVRLVADNGDQLGIVPVAQALKMAEEQNVDLVEIAPLARPPVCKLMDFGKFRYREQNGDYAVKLHKLITFLEEGDKTKVTLRFRGREMAHQEFGLRILERVKADLDAYGVVEQFPRLEGRQMVMVLAPKKKVLVTKTKKEAKQDAKEAKQDAPKPAQKPAEKPAAA